MNYRIKQILILISPLLLIIFVITIVKDWNNGNIVIHNAQNSILSIKEKTYEIDSNKFSLKLWPNNYQIHLKKIGYNDFYKNIEIKRQKDINIYPEFVFIPMVELINTNKELFLIPEENKFKNKNNEVMYKDNQKNIRNRNISSKELTNLPLNINYIFFNNKGGKAIIITLKNDNSIDKYYYYNLKTEKSIEINEGIQLSGLAWNETGDLLSYFEPLNKKEGRIMIYDTNKQQSKEINRLYNISSIYCDFVLNDTKLIILPTDTNERNLIEIDLEKNRKQKLTHTANIEKIKFSSNNQGLFYKQENNNKTYFLNLENKKLNIINQDLNLNKIDFLKTNNQIIYNKNINLELESFYLFNLDSWQTNTIALNNSLQTKTTKFITIDSEERHLMFLGQDNKYYKLWMRE